MTEPIYVSSVALGKLTLNRRSTVPLQIQLSNALRNSILNGELAAMSRLPSSRTLAKDLSLGRNTVTAVYDQLLAEGYLFSKTGSGTYVADVQDTRPMLLSSKTNIEKKVSPKKRASTKITSSAFVTGLPDLSAFPTTEWARTIGRIARRDDSDLMMYSDSAGQNLLRQQLVQHLSSTRGIRCHEDQIVITNGAQSALDLTMRLLLEPGSRMLIENPSWQGIRSVAKLNEVKTIPVTVDSEGLDVKSATQKLPAKMIFVTPSYQYPLGITMSIERRLSLLDFANKHDCWILEDDYDSDLRYRGRPLAALKSLDTDERVIYTGTFSKSMFSGIRIGYLVLPDILVDRFVRTIHGTGQQPSALIQRALAEFMSSGAFHRHLRKINKLYRQKQMILVEGLQQHCAKWLETDLTDAGMQLVALFRIPLNPASVKGEAQSAGLSVRPLSELYQGPCPRDGLFLGYAGIQSEKIDSYCLTLSEALKKAESE